MATKNPTSSKANAKSHPKSPKSKEPSRGLGKELAKTVKSKSKNVSEPVENVAPTPKIMSARGKKPSKKEPSATVENLGEKVDPEWTQYMNQSKDANPVPYFMDEDFQPKTIISHKLLGLGYVIKNQNNRIEVSFKVGKKTLVTNYKK